MTLVETGVHAYGKQKKYETEIMINSMKINNSIDKMMQMDETPEQNVFAYRGVMWERNC